MLLLDVWGELLADAQSAAREAAAAQHAAATQQAAAGPQAAATQQAARVTVARASGGGSVDDGAAITCRQLIVMGGMDLIEQDALPRSAAVTVANHCTHCVTNRCHQ